jgi:ABC-type amino acid transport substrate-binding protein
MKKLAFGPSAAVAAVALSLGLAKPVAAEGVVVLQAAAQPPYLEALGDKFSGTTLATMQCVFDRIERDYAVNLMPRKRMAALAKQGKIDGFFPSVISGEIGKTARPSVPLALEKWYWVQAAGRAIDLNNKSVIESANLGSVLGGNELDWLQKRGAKNILKVPQASILLPMIKLGRIDATIMDLKVFVDLVSREAGLLSDYDVRYLKYTPLVAYFTDRFLGENAGFLDAFNEAVPACSQIPITLAAKERAHLHAKVVKHIKSLISSPEIVAAIKNQNAKHANLTDDAVIAMDNKWRAAESDSEGAEIVAAVSQSSASSVLKVFKTKSDGLYTEVFVVDSKGLNVAMSDKTSDYWQGDEVKFKSSFGVGPDEVFIDDIEFDASSLTFQSQVSLTISDNGLPIGAITVGIDVEKALQGL